MFIVGLVFAPGLWNIVEYLFPFAIAGFLAIGAFALLIIGDFLGLETHFFVDLNVDAAEQYDDDNKDGGFTFVHHPQTLK